jgi:MFS family permease
LARNPDFRRLFVGQLISQAGDWFNTVAIFTLLLSLSSSGQSLAFVLILKLIPSFFLGPLAGVVADRYDRKTIMIAADFMRGLTVLGLLFVRHPDQIWIVYLLTTLEVTLATFFEPAKSAAIPGLVGRSDLVQANTLSAATWSVTLALGAALGGLVTDLFGRNTAFVIDAVSFFLSASFILRIRIRGPERPGRAAASRRASLRDALGFTDIIEGAEYLRSNLRVLALLLVKPGWGIGGGVLLLLTIFGKNVFPLGRDGSASIGLLYAARGLGALIGPMLARSIGGSSTASLHKGIAVAFFQAALFYLLFATAPTLWIAALLVLGAHAGGSIQWVYSTTLLQMAVPNRFLGRVFAVDNMFLTLALSVSTYLTGWGLDHGFGPRPLAAALGAIFVIPGIAWCIHLRHLSVFEPHRSDESREETDAAEA